jgi:hypothetical protein
MIELILSRRSKIYIVLGIFCAINFVQHTGYAETQIKSNQYLWYGRPLSELDGPNSDRIRATYLLIIKAFPSLRACAEENTTGFENRLTRHNLQQLPNLEAAEVCLFYSINLKKSEQKSYAEIVDLGFEHLETIKTKDHTRMRFIWNVNFGKLVKTSFIETLFHEATRSGIELSIDFSTGPTLNSLRLKPISKIQF